MVDHIDALSHPAVTHNAVLTRSAQGGRFSPSHKINIPENVPAKQLIDLQESTTSSVENCQHRSESVFEWYFSS